jgi:hypothetical protein
MQIYSHTKCHKWKANSQIVGKHRRNITTTTNGRQNSQIVGEKRRDVTEKWKKCFLFIQKKNLHKSAGLCSSLDHDLLTSEGECLFLALACKKKKKREQFNKQISKASFWSTYKQ